MTQTLPETAPLSPTTPGAANPKAVALLLKRAGGLERRAQQKETPSYVGMNMTRKRSLDAGSRADDAFRLRRLQRAYRAVASGLEDGTLPAVLARVTDPRLIELLVHLGPDHAHSLATVCLADEELGALRSHRPHSLVLESVKALPVSYGWLRELLPEQVNGVLTIFRELAPLKPFEHITVNCQRFVSDAKTWEASHACGLTTPALVVEAAAALRALAESRVDPARARRDRVAALERDLVGYRVPGFWPTPAPLATHLATLADLRPGLRVLEPQAGKGDLVDALLALEPELHVEVCEQNGRLREMLEAKGYRLIGDNSMALRGEWDRVVMNPPFEGLADISHVQHAYRLLAPGGVLVTVMGNGPFFRQEQVAQDFRAWLEGVDAEVNTNDPDAFKVSTTGHSTGVQTRTLRIVKPPLG
ncbi:hypothetical protein V3W47_08265 [Deinococcus sp. YIM 134068]|uniref:hypothetical protein n=1 Tax=Deinococcus lichenicola TaxID=3118910 RepID=UPI002F9400F2